MWMVLGCGGRRGASRRGLDICIVGCIIAGSLWEFRFWNVR
jgi:hypothetical protein